jgi:hypothetical protein
LAAGATELEPVSKNGGPQWGGTLLTLTSGTQGSAWYGHEYNTGDWSIMPLAQLNVAVLPRYALDPNTWSATTNNVSEFVGAVQFTYLARLSPWVRLGYGIAGHSRPDGNTEGGTVWNSAAGVEFAVSHALAFGPTVELDLNQVGANRFGAGMTFRYRLRR